jgi:hypothetical protein
MVRRHPSCQHTTVVLCGAHGSSYCCVDFAISIETAGEPGGATHSAHSSGRWIRLGYDMLDRSVPSSLTCGTLQVTAATLAAHVGQAPAREGIRPLPRWTCRFTWGEHVWPTTSA